MTAYLWVERLGNSQVSSADELNVSPVAVTKMVSKLRRDGLEKKEKRLVAKVLRKLLEDAERGSHHAQPEPKEPKVIILKKQRR